MRSRRPCPPLDGAAIAEKFVSGVYQATVTVLDINAILSDPNIIVSI